MQKKIALAGAAISLFGVLSVLFTGIATAEDPDAKCTDRSPIGEPRYDPCRRPATIIAAKVAAAAIYDRYLNGAATLAEVQAADRRVAQFTRTAIPEPSRNFIAVENGTDPLTTYPAGAQLNGFQVFHQNNYYYCGPATVQSMLFYFAKKDIKFKTAATFNPFTQEYDMVFGHPRDQHILANEFWLATDKYGGTNYGEPYVQFTLNAWRGDEYYTQHSTVTNGGTLNADEFMRAVRYSADRGFPIASNARYNGYSYYPAGFQPGIDYFHWDVIYGHFYKDGIQFVQQGQVFASPGYSWAPYQNVPWSTIWTALGSWYGIVW